MQSEALKIAGFLESFADNGLRPDEPLLREWAARLRGGPAEKSSPPSATNGAFIEKLRAPHTAYSRIGELRKIHTAAADLIQALDRELAQCDADWRKRGEIIREQREQLKAASAPSETRQSDLADIEEALWALHGYESNRDDAGRTYSEADITKMVSAVRASVPSATPRSEPDEDGERYRWFRDECGLDRQAEIVEAAEGVADMLDHHIDKGRCGL